MTYRYIPPDKKELVCDMASCVDDLKPLFDITGYGLMYWNWTMDKEQANGKLFGMIQKLGIGKRSAD
jgi:hypothetical protein